MKAWISGTRCRQAPEINEQNIVLLPTIER